jgi:hypothetical protein
VKAFWLGFMMVCAGGIMENRPDAQDVARRYRFLAILRGFLFDMLAARAQGTMGVPVRYSDRSR